MNPARRRETGELVALELADAVLGRDRAAGGGYEVIDEPRNLLAFTLVPVGCGMGGGANMEMDVAVAEMAEAASDHAWKPALDRRRSLDDEPRHVRDGYGDIVSERLPFGALGLRNRVAELPEGLGL